MVLARGEENVRGKLKEKVKSVGDKNKLMKINNKIQWIKNTYPKQELGDIELKNSNKSNNEYLPE